MFVLDSHCDTPSQILRLRDLAQDNDHAHVDFPKLKRGGVDGAFFALYVPAALDSDSGKAFSYARKLYDATVDCVRLNSDKAAFAISEAQALENRENGRFSVFMGLENGSPIGDSLERLHWFHEAGIRYVTLCHSGNNKICDSCAPRVSRWGGLSPFGKDVVAEMNRLGMLVDVSHVSDDSFYDILEYSSKPVVATHSCCRALADHPRNMTDDMIKALADAGGVIQINFYPLFIDSGFSAVLDKSGIERESEGIEAAFIADPSDAGKRMAWNRVLDSLQSLPRPSYRRIADHIDHVVELVGIEHVGLGSDFDGIEVTPDGMEDISGFSRIFDELRDRGYSEADLARISSGNFFRIL